MLTLLIVILFLSLIFGGWGHTGWSTGSPYPYHYWSPFFVVLVILVVLALTGSRL